MSRVLLLSSPLFSWREWLKDHLGTLDLLCLDPSEPAQTPPGRLALLRAGRPVYWRFYGSLDASRAPHILVAALAEMLDRSAGDCIVQMPPSRTAPLTRQLITACAQLVKPERILTPRGAEIDLEGFPVGPEEVEVESAFPTMVQQAQRKAQWLKLVESCEKHEVDLRRVSIEGARLGSGKPIHPDALAKAGLSGALHAEVAGSTLLIVSNQEVEEHILGRALDIFHASRAALVEPGSYSWLLCSFADQRGEDFGLGVVESIDFATGIARVFSTAVPPAPVRTLRLGGLRVDRTGREFPDVRPWQV